MYAFMPLIIKLLDQTTPSSSGKFTYSYKALQITEGFCLHAVPRSDVLLPEYYPWELEFDMFSNYVHVASPYFSCSDRHED